MGLMLAEPGYHTRAFVEWEPYPRSTIIAAQHAGYFSPAPIWDDVTSFDGRPFRGAFDTILAGYPCQPFSMAGQRKGADDERHLWPDVARIIREIGPEWVFLENVAGHITLGLETVLRELWGMGYTPAVGIFSAGEVGAPHERQRVFIVAHCDGSDGDRGGIGWPGRRAEPANSGRPVADPNGGNTSPERKQRGGQQRLLAQGGGIGICGLADASRGRRGGPRDGQDQQPRRAEAIGPCAPLGYSEEFGRRAWRAEYVLLSGRDTSTSTGSTMDDTASPRRDGARVRPEAEREGGECLPGDGCAELADASSARPQGREWRGSPEERHRAHAHGSTAERGCPRLFPPGPGDIAAWSTVLAMAPHRAPSVTLGDLAHQARNLAALVEGGKLEEAAAQSALRRMADGLADRSRALRLLGNGVHPLAAAHAWRTLSVAHGLGPVDLGTAGYRSDPDEANQHV